MQVLKTFIRDGQRYRPGDEPPTGLDKVAIAHYQRHGMLGQPPKAPRNPRKTTPPPPPPASNPTPPPAATPPADPPAPPGDTSGTEPTA